LESDPTIITSARYLSSSRPHPVYEAYDYGATFPYTVRMKARGIHSGQVALTTFQSFFTFCMLLSVIIMYEYFFVHVMALLGAFFTAAWFGASYYFEVGFGDLWLNY
jgi:hypothetical protein